MDTDFSKSLDYFRRAREEYERIRGFPNTILTHAERSAADLLTSEGIAALEQRYPLPDEVDKERIATLKMMDEVAEEIYSRPYQQDDDLVDEDPPEGFEAAESAEDEQDDMQR